MLIKNKILATFVVHGKSGAKFFEGFVDDPEEAALVIDTNPRKMLVYYGLAIDSDQLNDLFSFRGVIVIYKQEKIMTKYAAKLQAVTQTDGYDANMKVEVNPKEELDKLKRYWGNKLFLYD